MVRPHAQAQTQDDSSVGDATSEAKSGGGEGTAERESEEKQTRKDI